MGPWGCCSQHWVPKEGSWESPEFRTHCRCLKTFQVLGNIPQVFHGTWLVLGYQTPWPPVILLCILLFG